MALTLTQAQLYTDLRQFIGDKGDSFADRKLSRATITGLERLARVRSWSFHRDTYPVATVTPYSTGTASVAIGSTSVSGTLTVWTSSHVGAFIEFNGQRQQYEITARGGNTAITIRNAYANADAANLTDVTYKIFYPAIDLPANFKSLRRVVDEGRGGELDAIESDDVEDMHRNYAGVGSPSFCSIRAKRNDPNIMQLWLYPPPDEQEQYVVLYNRTPGWYDSSTVATASFSVEPATTSYFVDWPLNLKGLLLASCKLALIEDGLTGKDYGAVLGEYKERLREAESADQRQQDPEYLGAQPVTRRSRWRIGT